MYQTLNNLLVKTSGLTLNEAQVEAQVEGQTQDPIEGKTVKTLMLLHGWGMNSQVWEPIRESLEAQYHLLWVDLPGHGFNRHVEAQSLENMVKLIADVTPVNTHLVGWSLGGLVAQALAQKVPEKIKSMTLVTSTPRFSQVLLHERQHQLQYQSQHQEHDQQTHLENKKHDEEWLHAMSDEVLNRFATNLKQDTEKTLRGFIALQFIGVKNAKQAQTNLINHILGSTQIDSNNNEESTIELTEKDNSKKWGGVIFNNNSEQVDASVSDAVPSTVIEDRLCSGLEHTNIPTQEALDVGLTILKHADLRNVAPSCPQHWIFSEYDRLIPKEVINDLISLRPNAEITLLEKAGHAPFITHREDFLRHAIRFIEAL